MEKSSKFEIKIEGKIAKYLENLAVLLIGGLLTPIAASIFAIGRIEGFLIIMILMIVSVKTVVLGYKNVKKDHSDLLKGDSSKIRLVGILSTLVFATLYFFVQEFLNVYTDIIAGKMSARNAAVSGFAVSFSVGIILFVFRLKFRGWYGFSEMIVGFFIVVRKIYSANSSAVGDAEFYLAVLTAGVYLIVRGMDNIHQWHREKSQSKVK